jgi:hypothetical protein
MKKNANIIPMITIGIMYKSILTGGGVSKPGGGGGMDGPAIMELVKKNANSRIV